MDILAILKKAANGEELTDEERSALQNASLYTQEQLDEEANARAAKARKQGEGSKETLQNRIAEIEAERDRLKELAETKSKNTGDTQAEIDKAKAQVQKEYEAKLENLSTQLEEQKATEAARTRKDKLSAIRKRVGFVSTDAKGNPILDDDTADAILERKFAEIDTEDLDRDAVVTPLIKGIQDKNPHLIQDKSGGGTGHQHEEPAAGTGGLGGSLAGQSGASSESIAERQKELREMGV